MHPIFTCYPRQNSLLKQSAMKLLEMKFSEPSGFEKLFTICSLGDDSKKTVDQFNNELPLQKMKFGNYFYQLYVQLIRQFYHRNLMPLFEEYSNLIEAHGTFIDVQQVPVNKLLMQQLLKKIGKELELLTGHRPTRQLTYLIYKASKQYFDWDDNCILGLFDSVMNALEEMDITFNNKQKLKLKQHVRNPFTLQMHPLFGKTLQQQIEQRLGKEDKLDELSRLYHIAAFCGFDDLIMTSLRRIPVIQARSLMSTSEFEEPLVESIGQQCQSHLPLFDILARRPNYSTLCVDILNYLHDEKNLSEVTFIPIVIYSAMCNAFSSGQQLVALRLLQCSSEKLNAHPDLIQHLAELFRSASDFIVDDYIYQDQTIMQAFFKAIKPILIKHDKLDEFYEKQNKSVQLEIKQGKHKKQSLFFAFAKMKDENKFAVAVEENHPFAERTEQMSWTV